MHDILLGFINIIKILNNNLIICKFYILYQRKYIIFLLILLFYKNFIFILIYFFILYMNILLYVYLHPDLFRSVELTILDPVRYVR